MSALCKKEQAESGNAMLRHIQKYFLQCLLHLLFVIPLPKGGKIVNFAETFL